MTPEEFMHQKSQILDGIDLSRKGCIDDPIKGLVQFINEGIEFVTTSSCSGRVIIFCEDVTNGNRKKGCKWLYTSHENVNDDDLLNSVDPKEGNNILKYEPLILHVQCRTLESAKLMHTCALESGFRNSGITLGKHGKIILAVRSCIGLEVPLTEDGITLVSNEVCIKYL
ncbi:tRNA wybutosine-synthesizing protein 3 homolog [Zootermopsis nevadensis]|uniref:tRNA wybutosine-synthesizing protein 3 homolog n=1 Tax=Zootermopsis nevadensis TaxID=136037 RepID=UPI000B8E838A|nr:tRNA wybutosine-synthesizing protein 3 homolog [Zootermopsis nevadensis]